MRTRVFNSIHVDKHKGVLTKTSSNILKIRDEVNYYLALPSTIAEFFPKLVS